MLLQKGWLIHTPDGKPDSDGFKDVIGPNIDTTDPRQRSGSGRRYRGRYVKPYGFDYIWLDETEPDVDPAKDVFFVGSGTRFYNIYPLFHTASVYDGFRQDFGDSRRVMILAGKKRRRIANPCSRPGSDYQLGCLQNLVGIRRRLKRCETGIYVKAPSLSRTSCDNSRLRLIQPDVIEAVRLHVTVANLLPEPIRRLWIRGVDIRPDDLLEALPNPAFRPGIDQPAFASSMS